ncbi:MAG: hypothetical protein HQM11_00040 [SAR324 cluster bacterium]|nr:hypothetical protein [SAR324 cluster bacterium]
MKTIITTICLSLMLFGAVPIQAADILIYSSSHTSGAEITESEITVQLEIRAFEPLTEVMINGQTVDADGERRVSVAVPLILKEGENPIVVSAKTARQSAEENFVFIHKTEQPDHWSLMSQVALKLDSNVNEVSRASSRVRGHLWQAIVMPEYLLEWDTDTWVGINAVASRERYQENVLRPFENGFLRAIGFLRKNIEWGLWETGLGHNRINDQMLEPSNSLDIYQKAPSRQNQTELYTQLHYPFSDTLRMLGKLTLKQQTISRIPTDPGYNDTAALQNLSLRIYWRFDTNNTLLGRWERENHDAQGKYTDHTTIPSPNLRKTSHENTGLPQK